MVDGVFRNYYKDNKVKNKIEKLENHVILCGYGRNGKQASIELVENDVHVVDIEEKESVLEQIRKDVDLLYINGDSASDDILMAAQITSAKLVAQPDIVEFLEYIMLQGHGDVFIEELSCQQMASRFKGKSIQELDRHNESGPNIIGSYRSDRTYLINPSSDFVLGSEGKIKKLKDTLEHLKRIA